MKSKPFKDVQIGDTVTMSCEPHEVEGTIMWKGTFNELKENEAYQSFAELIEENNLDELDDYPWVIVNTKTEGPILFNYDCDPSGVMVPIEESITLGPYIYNEELEELHSKIVANGEGPELYFISVTNAIYIDEEVIDPENVKTLVIAVTSSFSIAKSIFEKTLFTTEVKGLILEGIHGVIREKRTIKNINYRVIHWYEGNTYDEGY